MNLLPVKIILPNAGSSKADDPRLAIRRQMLTFDFFNSSFMKYKKHVFICTNQKEAPKKSCGELHGLALVDAFKSALKERDLAVEIRAQKTGCLDVCGRGPGLVVYPEGVFYGNVQLTDVDEIVESHLVNNIPVERLQLSF